MSNQATLNKLNHKIEDMKREIDLLRSFAISIAGKDPEGEYRPEFIKKVLAASKEKPLYEFKDAKSFLRQIRHIRNA